MNSRIYDLKELRLNLSILIHSLLLQKIDGYDIRTVNLAHLRSKIGLVTQEPILFDYSIRDNIAYGAVALQESVSFDDIVRAAKLANVHDFVMNLPEVNGLSNRLIFYTCNSEFFISIIAFIFI